MKYRFSILACLLALSPLCGLAQNGIIGSQFISDNPPTASAHASTLVETKDTLICAWFGGSEEGANDVGIWLSRNENGAWQKPTEVANGYHEADRLRYPCWNPVLFRAKDGPLYLFYKEGPSPIRWWGMMKFSEDNGRTWSTARKLPSRMLGPIKNKPIQLPDGTIIFGSSSEDNGWHAHIERTKDPLHGTWSRMTDVNRSMDFAAIQPAILLHKSGDLQMLCRTKQGVIIDSWSRDRGETWTRPLSLDIPNPNSGLDAVMTAGGKAIMVYNHSAENREVLNVAVSEDGRNWNAALTLENERGAEFSYPAVIQSADKLIHITYTWKRQRIKHVAIDPSQLQSKPIVNGRWPN